MFSVLLVMVATTINAQKSDVAVEQDGPFSPTWESMTQWECPEWFKNAKFGIWAHWGPQCQAEDGDWYPRRNRTLVSGRCNVASPSFT